MDERLATGLPTKRNVLAYVALWLVVLTWVMLGMRVVAGTIGTLSTPLDWTYVVALGGGLACAAAAVASIRARGEPMLAITVLAFSLVLPAIYALVFLALGLAPDGGGWD